MSPGPLCDGLWERRNLTYLRRTKALYKWDHVQRCVFGFQALHFGIKAFPLWREKKIIEGLNW